MRQHFHLFCIGRFRMGFLSFTFTMFYFGRKQQAASRINANVTATESRCGINESTMVVKAKNHNNHA